MPLTVTADNQSRFYSDANPTLTTTVTGFVNGESAATAAGYGGSGGASTLATANTPVGTATISASTGTLTANNSTFRSLVDGTLTINPLAPVIVIPTMTPPLPGASSVTLSPSTLTNTAATSSSTNTPTPASAPASSATAAPGPSSLASVAVTSSATPTMVAAVPDIVLPATSLSVAANGQGGISVSGKAAPGELVTVTFADGSKGLAVAATDGSYTVKSSGPQTDHKVKAVASARAGNVAVAVATPAPPPTQVASSAPKLTATARAPTPASPTPTPGNALATITPAASVATAKAPTAASAAMSSPAAESTSAPAPGTIRFVQQSIAGSANPIVSVNLLVDAQVSRAMSSGLPANQAARAGKAFSEVLVKQLSMGVPAAKAAENAQKVFQAEASFPAPKSPQEAAIKNLSSTGQNINTTLIALASASTSDGTAAFDRSLAVALAKGESFGDAVKSAQQAVKAAENLAKADNSPRSVLAAGGNKAIGPLAKQSAAFQKSLSSLLAKGISAQEAWARAAEIEAYEQKLIAAEQSSPLSGLANGGGTALPKEAPGFDQALASALSRGESPSDAIASARRTLAKVPAEVFNPSTALASGKNTDTLLNSPGNSPIFKTVLAAALIKGSPIDKALAEARAAEETNAFHFALPAQMAKTKVTVTLANGEPLPPWLHYLPETKSFVAFNVPEGGFPVKVLVSGAGQQSSVTISEHVGPIRTTSIKR